MKEWQEIRQWLEEELIRPIAKKLYEFNQKYVNEEFPEEKE